MCRCRSTRDFSVTAARLAVLAARTNVIRRLPIAPRFYLVACLFHLFQFITTVYLGLLLADKIYDLICSTRSEFSCRPVIAHYTPVFCSVHMRAKSGHRYGE